MKTFPKQIALAVASLFVVGTLSGISYAQSKPASPKDAAIQMTDSAAKSAMQADRNSFVQSVDEAYKGVREVRAARVAIFNGDVGQVDKLVKAALKDFTIAHAAAELYGMTPKGGAAGEEYVPFDTSISLAEDFVATPEKQIKVNQANEHFTKGHTTKAAEVLKLADIEVVVSTALVPTKASISHINNAIKLIGEKKYFEANLAMKAVEDSIVVDAYGMDAVPMQGKADATGKTAAKTK